MPPVDRMFIITAWFATILYGANLVIFGVCMYILWHRKKKAHWIIPASCTLYISIATAHNVIYLLRALQGFTNRTIISTPDGSTLYFLRVTTALSMTNWGLYIINVLAVNLLLIWRLYVVWQCVWLLVVFLTLEAAHTATAVVTWALALRYGQVFARNIHDFGNACFALNLAVTIGVTSGIAYHLWRAGRTVSPLIGYNVYKAAIYIVIESGALYTASFVVQTILLICKDIIGILAMDVNIQIATMVPLLLIARLGFSLRGKETTRAESSTFVEPIQVSVTEDRYIYPLGSSSDSESTRKVTQSYTKSSEKSIGSGAEITGSATVDGTRPKHSGGSG